MSLNEQNIWRNKYSFYFIKIDLIGLAIFSVFAKWIQSGMSFSQILLLQGLFGIFILISEFPSGILADIRSRKELLLLGQIFIILGIFLYLISSTFFEFLMAELFFAIGIASKSGTINAFAYDSYLEIGQANSSDDTIARGQQITLFFNIFMLSLGGYLTVIDFNLPFIVAILGYTITTASLLFTKEPQRKKIKSSKIVLKKSVTLLKHSVILKVLLMMLFLGVMLRVAFWAYIPILETTTLDPQFFGLVLGGANLVAFLSSLFAKKLRDHKIILYLVPIGVIGLITMTLNGITILLFSIFLHQVSRGVIQIVASIYLNRAVESEVRASISSLVSTIVSLMYFLFSFTMDLIDLNQMFILMINISLGLIFLIIWYISQIKSTNKVVS